MTAPLFTVVVPTFNRFALLHDALESIWTQELNDYELIIVDDGSTDGTGEWLATLSDRAVVLTQPNRGPGAARNLALQHARGKYVAFLDSDDRWFPWTLAAYAEVIERHKAPSLITASVVRFKDAGLLSNVHREPLAVERFRDYLASSDRCRWYGLSSFVVVRGALESVSGFFDEPFNGEDADLALRLGDAAGYVHITAPITFAYREHSGGVSHDTRKMLDGLEKILAQEQSGIYPGGEARRRERWRIIGRYMRPGALVCLRSGFWSDAWKLYLATWYPHVKEGRWRFILGFPLFAAACALGFRRKL